VERGSVRDTKISFEESVKTIERRVAEFYLKVKELNFQSLASKSSKIPSEISSKSTPPVNSVNELIHNIEKLCREEKKKINLLYPNHNTKHRYFTKYRKALLAQDLPENLVQIIKHHLRPPREEIEARNRMRDERIDSRTNNVVLFDGHLFLKTFREFFEKSLSKIEDHLQKASRPPAIPFPERHPGRYQEKYREKHQERPHPHIDSQLHTLVIGLLALTGRRPIEILKTGAFQWVDNRHVRFLGQAKTKNSPRGRDCYVIPTLGDAGRIVAGLAILRKLLPLSSWENERINQTWANRIRRHLRPWGPLFFPQNPHHLSPRSLRSLYVTTAYDLFNVRRQASFNAFAAGVLGHSQGDKDTANCYAYFALESPLSKREKDKNKEKESARRKR